MGKTGDVYDILCPVRAEGSAEVHLAQSDWPEGDDVTTLCGRPIRHQPPTRSFLTDGCFHCAMHAVGAGIDGIRESSGVVVDLARFIDAEVAHAPSHWHHHAPR